MLVDVLPCYLLRMHAYYRYLLYILQNMIELIDTWERLRVHLAMSVTQSRDWKATGRYEAGNQCCSRSTSHHGKNQDGKEGE